MTEDRSRQRKALIETIRRAETTAKVDFNALLFKQQRDFVEDPARLKAAVCSRRAGKSEGIAHLLLKEALSQKDVLLPYITLTTQHEADSLHNLTDEELAALAQDAVKKIGQ